MSTPGPAVIVTRRGNASWARISCRERGNACGSAVLTGLERWLSESRGDPDVTALVLTGTDTVFCAGADMKEGAAHLDDTAALAEYIRRGRDFVEAFADAPVATVAAVNGGAFAGGFELVLAADFAVATRSARLGDCHVAHGVVPGWGSTARLPRIAGPRAATRLLLTGETLSAEEMYRLGVLTCVAEDGELEAVVDDLVGRIASGPAARQILALDRQSLDRSHDAALAAEWDALVAHLADPVFRAGVRRFLGPS